MIGYVAMCVQKLVKPSQPTQPTAGFGTAMLQCIWPVPAVSDRHIAVIRVDAHSLEKRGVPGRKETQ